MKLRTRFFAIALPLFVILAIAVFYGMCVEASRRTIDRESKMDGVSCTWHVDGQQVDLTPSLWQIACGARLTEIHIGWPAFKSDHQAAAEFSAAVRFLGSLEEFSVDYNCPEVMTLLTGFGRQPHLTDIHCFHAPVTDAISQALLGFPHLQQISLVPSQFTGRGFPVMQDLVAADLCWSPITPEGLNAIAASPKLQIVRLWDHPNAEAALFDAIKELHATRPNLDVKGPVPP